MKFLSPAKINMHLGVGGPRHDGFHSICSWFLKVKLYDEIDVDTAAHINGISVEGNTAVPPERDLIAKAASLFFRETRLEERCRIRVRKRIPIGAGLGGGSSNAATVLMALNELHNCRLKHEELLKLSLYLGSDVPFFLGGPSAIVTGRGEEIEEISTIRTWWALIVDPGFSISTKDAYAWLDAAAEELKDTRAGQADRGTAEQEAYRLSSLNKAEIRAMAEGNPEKWQFCNDFSPVLYKRYPVLRAICGDLLSAGAIHAGVSGSGSACFGLFESYVNGANAIKNVSDMPFWLKETLAS